MTPATTTYLDEAHLQKWVGKTTTTDDVVTPQLLRAFRATFEIKADGIGEDSATPYGIHWCLSPPTVPMSEIGEDGHPKRGGFLPPVPLPRRMWAGGRLAFHDGIRAGDQITRVSTILSVKTKMGRTGPLCFVVVEHRCISPRGLAVVEEHDIVYREIETLAAKVDVPVEILPEAEISRIVDPSPVLLFRYSALTFNGHRIHYDRDYVTKVENYPGLIVHGPLQATLLMDLATRLQPGRSLSTFSFRATKPLFDTASFTVNGQMTSADTGRLWISGMNNTLHMDAQAVWS